MCIAAHQPNIYDVFKFMRKWRLTFLSQILVYFKYLIKIRGRETNVEVITHVLVPLSQLRPNNDFNPWTWKGKFMEH